MGYVGAGEPLGKADQVHSRWRWCLVHSCLCSGGRDRVVPRVCLVWLNQVPRVRRPEPRGRINSEPCIAHSYAKCSGRNHGFQGSSYQSSPVSGLLSPSQSEGLHFHSLSGLLIIPFNHLICVMPLIIHNYNCSINNIIAGT